MPITDPLFYLAAVPAVLLAGIGKGGLGGLGLLSVPLMALVAGPVQAAGVMLPILCVMDLFGLWAYRRSWNGALLRVMLPGALIGIGAGTLAFGHLDEDAVRLVIGLLAVGFAGRYWLTRLLARPEAAARAPSRAAGVFWAGVSGFTSFLAHAGGPPVMVWLLPQRLDRMTLAGTTVVLFGVVNWVKLLPYGWLGQLGAANMATALVLSPLAPLGIWMGVRLTRRLNDGLFHRLSHAVLLLTGLKLCADAFSSSP